MNIRPPSWELIAERCSYCSDQGELIFSRCPACSVIVLICGECGTVCSIADKRPAIEIGDTSGATVCYSCRGASHHDFLPATIEEIQALGFSIEDCQ